MHDWDGQGACEQGAQDRAGDLGWPKELEHTVPGSASSWRERRWRESDECDDAVQQGGPLRDKQLEENKNLEQDWSEEQKRLDLLMETERLKDLK
jgi:hypothetical protein